MRIVEIEQNTDEWLQLRQGKITGSKLKDIIVKRGKGKKIGFYQLIADRLAIEPDDESARDRGHRLEDEALALFQERTKIIVDMAPGMWISDDNENIAISPDAGIKSDDDVYRGAVEVKCLGSARHLQAVIENKIPGEYEDQAIQYFIVNEDLERLYFCFYDPRIASRPFHMLEILRETYADLIEEYKKYELDTLAEVDEWVERLAF